MKASDRTRQRGLSEMVLLGVLVGASAAQANNPLANMTAFNLQDYYIGRLTETDEDGNQFWPRFAKPFEVAGTNWIMRASLPVNTLPAAADGDLTTGIGDLDVFAAYLFDTDSPAVSFGLGPQITARLLTAVPASRTGRSSPASTCSSSISCEANGFSKRRSGVRRVGGSRSRPTIPTETEAPKP